MRAPRVKPILFGQLKSPHTASLRELVQWSVAMPMTPWHLGPGLAFKAVAGSRMSLLTFAVAQPLIDAEVVFRILNQLPHPHGLSHTIGGAIVVAGVTVGLTTPTVQLAACILGRRSDRPWLTWRAAWCGALLGTLSHVALDSIMHSDVFPFWPLSRTSPLYKTLGLTALHELCFWTGAIGVIAWGVMVAYRRWMRLKTASTSQPKP